MSNAPYIPPPPPADRPPSAPEPGPVDYEQVPSTGVRRVLEAFEERDLQRIRWGAVIAGIFLAVATQIVLGLLGVAVGLSAIDPRSPVPLQTLGTGAGIWMGVSSLIALFIGGYAAARLGGSIRRGDGALAGLLTWAVSLVLAIWLVGFGASAAMRSMMTMPEAQMRARDVASQVGAAPDQAARGVDQALRTHTADVTKAGWGVFIGVCVSLIAALLGGVAGAVGKGPTRPHRRGLTGRRELVAEEEDAYRRARERDREAMAR